jgi:hypothetical protein
MKQVQFTFRQKRNYVKVTLRRRALDKRESGQTYRLAVDGFNGWSDARALRTALDTVFTIPLTGHKQRST